MALGAIGGSTGLDTNSILRVGLTGLKPIKVSEIIKRYGIKFRSVYTKYELDAEITSIEDYTNIRYSQIFSNIKIPEHFEIEKLTEYYSNRTIKAYNEDKEYKEKVEEVKKSRGSLGPFLDFIKYMKSRYQDDINKLYEVNAKNFYASDLPFSLYNDFSRTDHMYASFLNLLHHTLNYYDRRIISVAKGNQLKFNKTFGEMKNELDVVFDLIDDMIFKEKCLQRLIVIWNVDNYDNLKKIKRIYYKNIPDDEFNRLYYDLKKSIRTTRINILSNKRYREVDDIDIRPPQIQYNSQELLKNIFYQDNLRVPVWNRN